MVNPFDPKLRSNPYELYKELRETDPVHWSEILQVWVLTRYDDVNAVLHDHARFSSERSRATNPFIQEMESSRKASDSIELATTMLNMDPPGHTRLRTLVSDAFTPKVVERIRPHIREIADELLADLPADGKIDLVRDFAVPLPMIVIAELLGVPPADRAQFKAWSNDITSPLGQVQPAEEAARAEKSSNELAAYFRGQIALRREQPGDDLLSELMAAEERGDLLSEDELIETCMLLLIAGNENTGNLIGTGMLALLRNPDQRRRLQEEPELMSSAIEEMVRYDSPAQMTFRVAKEEVELRGRRIEPGQVLMLLVSAANRDPERFPDPDSFDIGRQDSHHLAFGYGIHYCLGAPLAVAEAQVAFEALLRRFPEPEADVETPDWGPSLVMRGIKSLPLK